MSYKTMAIGLPLASIMLALGQTAYADEAPAAKAEGEIIVTAQRRSENLRDVPMAIAALSADQLSKSGISSTADLAKASPSVTIPQYGGFMQPSIRGISSAGASLGDNSNVAMYVDGIYQPQQIGTLITLPDVQQVEILKGPQGALYGQNATGGAILVSTLEPSSKLTGKFSAGYGNYNDVNLKGYISIPLSDNWAMSLSGGLQQRDGFRQHVITGQRDLGLDSQVLRAKLRFRPNDGVSLTLTGFISDYKNSAPYSGFAYENNTLTKGLGLGPVPVATRPNQFSTDPDVRSSNKSKGTSLAAEFDIGVGKVRSLTAYMKNEANYRADVDFSPVNWGQAVTELPLYGSYFTQELNFASNQMGSVSFITGAFFLTGGEEFARNTFQVQLAPSLQPAPRGAFVRGQDYYGRLDKQVFAVYADITLKATEQLTFTVGGRYTSERQRGFYGPYTGVVAEYKQDPVKFSKFTPRITARYAVSPDANFYASWGKGFKSGIINIANLNQDPVRPENIQSFEAGFKGKFFDALTLDLSAFHYDYKDLQVVIYDPLKSYQQLNAASARINGFEANASLAVTPEWKLSGSVGFLDAKFVSFPGAVLFKANGFGNTQLNNQDISGRAMPRAPKFTGSFAIDYNTETSIGGIGAHVGVYHNSGSAFDITGYLRQQNYTTVDAEISVSPKGMDGLRLVAWGKNLGNRAYFASFLDSTLTNGVTYADPLTYGARVEYKF